MPSLCQLHANSIPAPFQPSCPSLPGGRLNLSHVPRLLIGQFLQPRDELLFDFFVLEGVDEWIEADVEEYHDNGDRDQLPAARVDVRQQEVDLVGTPTDDERYSDRQHGLDDVHLTAVAGCGFGSCRCLAPRKQFGALPDHDQDVSVTVDEYRQWDHELPDKREHTVDI